MRLLLSKIVDKGNILLFIHSRKKSCCKDVTVSPNKLLEILVSFSLNSVFIEKSFGVYTIILCY